MDAQRRREAPCEVEVELGRLSILWADTKLDAKLAVTLYEHR